MRIEVQASGYSRSEMRLMLEKEIGARHEDDLKRIKEKHSRALIGLENRVAELAAALSKQRGEESKFRIAAAAEAINEGLGYAAP